MLGRLGAPSVQLLPHYTHNVFDAQVQSFKLKS